MALSDDVTTAMTRAKERLTSIKHELDVPLDSDPLVGRVRDDRRPGSPAQVGELPASGISSKMHRKQGVSPGMTVIVVP